MPENIYLEIDENDNSEYMPMQVFEALADPVPVSRVRLFEPGREHGVYEVTGWSSEGDGSPCPAMYAPVSDSGQAEAYLVFGGDWGVRFRPGREPRGLGHRQRRTVGRALPGADRPRRHTAGPVAQRG